MRSIASYHREFESNNMITITTAEGTITISEKEWKKQNRKPTKKNNKVVNTKTIKQIPIEVKNLMKQVKVLKSLVAYKENGYKQWGTIANTIMNMRGVKMPFEQVVIKTKQAERLIKKIDTIAKANDYDVFQYVNRLQLRLEELTTQLNLLVNGITSSHVTKVFKDHEAINGEGRRLGLRILCLRSTKAVDELEIICQRLWDIQEKGVDVFEYDTNGRRR
jgi:hypothetical protein